MNTIRKARVEDFAAVHNLLAESESVCDDLTLGHLMGFVVIPAEDGSSLAAVASVETFPHSEDGLLRSVAVASALRGRGVGTALVSAVETRSLALGLRQLWLLTTTAPDFFRQLGYADTQRNHAPLSIRQSGEFLSLCPSTADCMTKAFETRA